MDNFRRTFLTKEEVKKIGIELTENTTDDIAVLWLPLDRQLLLGGAIAFNYRTKDHTDVNTVIQGKSGSDTYKSNINNEFDRDPIVLYYNYIKLNYKLSFTSGSTYRDYNIYYNGIREMTNLNTPNSGGTYTYYDIPMSNYMDVTDMYIKIDITKINMRFIGGGTFTDFLIKYRSGNIPANTIFYEPYED